MDYAYKGRMKIDTESALELLQLGSDLGCFWIRRWCSEFITEHSSDFDKHQVWNIAKRTGNRLLSKLCCETLLSSVNILNVGAEFYENLHPDAFLVLLKEVKNITEEEKLRVIGNYMKKTKKEEPQDFMRLLKTVKLNEISEETITDIVSGISNIYIPGKCV